MPMITRESCQPVLRAEQLSNILYFIHLHLLVYICQWLANIKGLLGRCPLLFYLNIYCSQVTLPLSIDRGKRKLWRVDLLRFFLCSFFAGIPARVSCFSIVMKIRHYHGNFCFQGQGKEEKTKQQEIWSTHY